MTSLLAKAHNMLDEKSLKSVIADGFWVRILDRPTLELSQTGDAALQRKRATASRILPRQTHQLARLLFVESWE